MKSVLEFQQKKALSEKITMVTCYDYTSACIIDQSEIDCVLVGDSGCMVMLGKEDTTQATLQDMQFMTRAVANGLNNKFIIADLPFMSYRQSLPLTMQAVTALIQAGAHAVKLEGAVGNLETIRHIVDSGVPVMGHLGLTPQFVHGLGGFKVQGKTEHAADQLMKQVEQLNEAGCFAIVLECVPWPLGKQMTDASAVPTIGIGAGAETDGQVLVLSDLLGLNQAFKPKFVKTYLHGAEHVKEAVNQFVAETKSVVFPSKKQAYLVGDA